MDFKLSITFFVIMISSSIYLGNGAELDLGGLMGAAGGQSSIATSPCLPKLLPCQPFVGSESKPTDACCGPLKEIFGQQTKCLCDAFQNPSMLAAINVTKDEILKLPKACGLEANEDICKSLGSNPSASPGSNSTDTKTVDSSGKPVTDASSNSDSKYATKGIYYLSGYSITAFVVALIVSP